MAPSLHRRHTRAAEADVNASRKDAVVVPNHSGLPDTSRTQQILLEKQALDCFTNVNLPALLDRLGAERCVVYGVVAEICVKFAAFGLLKTGRRVELVTEAIKELDPRGRVGDDGGIHRRGRRPHNCGPSNDRGVRLTHDH